MAMNPGDHMAGKLSRANYSIRRQIFLTVGIWCILFLIVLSSCSALPTTTLETNEPEATQTEFPTPTPNPTENPYEIDMQKFTNFPQSYEYLLSHLNEFVQSPDPVTDRAAFDKWFNEEFLPALGPVSEREINVGDGGFGGWIYGFGFANNDGRLHGQLHSFYFSSNDIVYFVPCFHVVQDAGNPYLRDMTVCIAIFDSPAVLWGNEQIEMIAQGRVPQRGDILFAPSSDRPDLDWGEMDAIIRSVGNYISDENNENYVRFGFGYFNSFYPNSE